MPTVQEIVNIGFELHQKGELKEAETAYNEALKIDNNNAEVYNLIGVLKLQQGETDLAINYIENAIQKSPQAYFYETLIQAYIRKGNYKGILELEPLILKNYSNNFVLMFNLGLAHKNFNQIKEAIKCYEMAVKIDPSSYRAWFNLAHVYSIEGEAKNAVSALKICKKLHSKDDDTDYFLSLALMRTKDYKNGLKFFETRLCRETAMSLQCKSYPNKLRMDNIWHGENIKDKTILIYYEAGFGDTIMFARYLPLVAKKCRKLMFLVHKPLGNLFRENAKHLGIDEVIDRFIPENDLDFDVHAPLLSLPYILKLSGNGIFTGSERYLTCNMKLAKDFKEKFFENEKIKIGIKWQGNTSYDTARVIPAEAFVPLTEISNTQFYSFQTFEGKNELEKIEDKGVIDVGGCLNDFNQTAAAIANLDLVICNDTSLAHLAGAMGVPCWIILPYEVNWRWHTDLSVCDWYNSVRLFRQKTYGDWAGVFDNLKQDIIKAIGHN